MTTTSPDYYEKQSAQDSRMAVLETKVQDLEEQLERFKDKDQEELNDRLRKLEKWVWGAGAVIAKEVMSCTYTTCEVMYVVALHQLIVVLV